MAQIWRRPEAISDERQTERERERERGAGDASSATASAHTAADADGRTRQRQIELISQWFCCVIADADDDDDAAAAPPPLLCLSERARRQPPSPPRIAVNATAVARLSGPSSSSSERADAGRAWRKPAVDFGQCSSRDGPYRPIDRWETAMNNASEAGAAEEGGGGGGGDGTGNGGSHDSLFPRTTMVVGRKSTFPDMGHKKAVAMATRSKCVTLKAISRFPGLLLFNGYSLGRAATPGPIS